jgi:hypothetical protein
MGSNRDIPGTADAVVTSSLTVQPDRKRAEAVHRLQIGAAGIGAMILLIGLATVIMERAQITEAASVPDAAATVEPVPSPTKNDPLAEAGVVPDMPAQDDQQTVQEQAIVPEQGDSAPAQ